jgi:hypothetical protein
LQILKKFGVNQVKLVDFGIFFAVEYQILLTSLEKGEKFVFFRGKRRYHSQFKLSLDFVDGTPILLKSGKRVLCIDSCYETLYEAFIQSQSHHKGEKQRFSRVISSRFFLKKASGLLDETSLWYSLKEQYELEGGKCKS